MSVTITFLTYSSYTSQSTAIFIPVYLFIAHQCVLHHSAMKFSDSTAVRSH